MTKKPGAKHDIIISGQRWYENDASSDAWWTVMSISENGMIGLTGPTICRAYRYITDDEFLKTWTLCEQQPERRDGRR